LGGEQDFGWRCGALDCQKMLLIEKKRETEGGTSGMGKGLSGGRVVNYRGEKKKRTGIRAGENNPISAGLPGNSSKAGGVHLACLFHRKEMEEPTSFDKE